MTPRTREDDNAETPVADASVEHDDAGEAKTPASDLGKMIALRAAFRRSQRSY